MIWMQGLAAFALAFALAGCGSGFAPVPLQTPSYSGSVPAQSGGGQPVTLVFQFYRKDGSPYDANSGETTQYRRMAEVAFKQAGYSVVPGAPTTVTIALRGQTQDGIMENRSSLVEAGLKGMLTLGLACTEMQHIVDAAGDITIARAGAAVASRAINMQLSETSCFSRAAPNWDQAYIATASQVYAKAANQHIGAVLAFVAPQLSPSPSPSWSPSPAAPAPQYAPPAPQQPMPTLDPSAAVS